MKQKKLVLSFQHKFCISCPAWKWFTIISPHLENGKTGFFYFAGQNFPSPCCYPLIQNRTKHAWKQIAAKSEFVFVRSYAGEFLERFIYAKGIPLLSPPSVAHEHFYDFVASHNVDGVFYDPHTHNFEMMAGSGGDIIRIVTLRNWRFLVCSSVSVKTDHYPSGIAFHFN